MRKLANDKSRDMFMNLITELEVLTFMGDKMGLT